MKSPILIFFLAILQLAAGSSARADDAEKEPFLQAAHLVQPALLNGPNYKVASEVEVRGFMAHFLIDTPWGPLNADSTQLLAIRVGEIPAIEVLDRASHSGAFAHAIAARGEKIGTSIVKVFAHPIDSIVGLPMGVARYFGKEIKTWTTRVQSASDQSSRHFENKGDPYRAPDGPMIAARDAPHATALPDIESDEPDTAADSHTSAKSGKTWYTRAGSELKRDAKTYLKYSQARSAMAKYLGIDPNTSNPMIVERLDSLAWAAVGGNFSAGEALSAITGPAATVIADTGLVDQYVLTHTPEQVREHNENRLAALCSDAFGTRQFSKRGGFNDTLRTQLINALEKLKPASGCDELLELGAATRGEVEARFLVNALSQILHESPNATGGKLIVVGAALLYRPANAGASDALILPLPLDYLTWSNDIGTFFDRAEFKQTRKIVLVGGDASMRAQRELTARGWSLVLRAAYDGAPVYPSGEFAGYSSPPP